MSAWRSSVSLRPVFCLRNLFVYLRFVGLRMLACTRWGQIKDVSYYSRYDFRLQFSDSVLDDFEPVLPILNMSSDKPTKQKCLQLISSHRGI